MTGSDLVVGGGVFVALAFVTLDVLLLRLRRRR